MSTQPGEGHTEARATIRIFGKLVEVTVPFRSLVLITSNNAPVRVEMLRRSLRIRIVANTDKPELRRFDFEPYEEAAHHRVQIVAAGITIIKAWWAQRETTEGQFIRRTTLGSFEAWADLVAGAVEWLLGMNPIALIEEAKAEDIKRSAEREVINALYARFDEDSWTAKQAVTEPPTTQPDELHVFSWVRETWEDVLNFRDKPTARQVGNWLARHRDRVFGEHQLTCKLDRNSIAQWQLRVLRGRAGTNSPPSTPNSSLFTQPKTQNPPTTSMPTSPQEPAEPALGESEETPPHPPGKQEETRFAAPPLGEQPACGGVGVPLSPNPYPIRGPELDALNEQRRLARQRERESAPSCPVEGGDGPKPHSTGPRPTATDRHEELRQQQLKRSAMEEELKRWTPEAIRARTTPTEEEVQRGVQESHERWVESLKETLKGKRFAKLTPEIQAKLLELWARKQEQKGEGS